MPTLTELDIQPGRVAYFDQRSLEVNPGVQKTYPQPSPRPGPFLCLEADGTHSTWSPITTDPSNRYKRLAIRPEWRSGGPQIWRNSAQFLNDGANLYRGSHAEFLGALSDSPLGEWLAAGAHAAVDEVGLAAARAEVRKQERRRQHPL